MSNSNLNIKLNTRTNYEGNKNSKSQIFSDSDDEEVETFSNVVNSMPIHVYIYLFIMWKKTSRRYNCLVNVQFYNKLFKLVSL